MDAEEDSSSQTYSGANQPSAGSTPQTGSAPSASGASAATNPASGSGTPSAQLSKRRRGLGVVTPNACTECRKKRAKCDGQRPCSRCRAQKDIECVYEIPVRQSKENLRTEIDTLRRHQRSSEQIFAALVQPNLWEEVLSRIRSGQPIEGISEWVVGSLSSGGGALPSLPSHSESGMASGSGYGTGAGPSTGLGVNTLSPVAPPPSSLRNELAQGSTWQYPSQSQAGSTRSGSLPDAMSWTAEIHGGPPQSRVGSWAETQSGDPSSEGMSRLRGMEQILSPLKEPGQQFSSGTWTTITADMKLAQHLLALYFCWEYPTFASLSKEHFLGDFHDGRHRYCSSILVNALLALGCRFSTQPTTRANPNDPYSSGDHFFKESLRLFHDETDHHSLTTIQALGIMSIREASCGRDSESWYYAGQSIRLAIEMGLHNIFEGDDEDEVAVRSATFWGAFALDHAWSLATGSLPQCSSFPHLPPKPAIIDDIESSLWMPYTDDGAPLQRSCEQPSNVRSVYKCFCESSELVHKSLYILHSPGKPLIARDLLGIYTQYLNWYDKIPEVLRLGHNFTPAVLFAHMYYHFAILLLFRPLIKLRLIGSKVSPRDVCSQAAVAIQGLLRSYSQLYTLRRTPSFVPYFVLTAAIMHLAIGAADAQTQSTDPGEVFKTDPQLSEAISQGIADLAEMAPCHQFAEQALNILRYLAKRWKIDVQFDGDKETVEDFDNLVRPYTGSMNFFAPNVQSEDLMCDWGGAKDPGKAREKLSTQKTAEGMENLLFWPFPMQGRPMLPTKDALEQSGFAML